MTPDHLPRPQSQSELLPCHLTLWKNKQLQGALCLYEKTNGYGEYIFDWGWANAYEQHGLDYYPKLVSAIPFTPATGRRLGDLTGDAGAIATMATCVKAMSEELEISSWHVLFLVWVLAPRIPEVDATRAVEIAIVHDLADLRSGDLPRPAGRYFPEGAQAPPGVSRELPRNPPNRSPRSALRLWERF